MQIMSGSILVLISRCTMTPEAQNFVSMRPSSPAPQLQPEDCAMGVGRCRCGGVVCLTRTIGSAQTSIQRCQSTLRRIEGELALYSGSSATGAHLGDSNTNNSKQRFDVRDEPDSEPDSLMDQDRLPPAKDVHLFYPAPRHKDHHTKVLNPSRAAPVEPANRKGHKNIQIALQEPPVPGMCENTNVCNISGELTNLLRAQQKLICQIEKLKCEVGDKAGLIDTCIKDNQYLSCRYREMQQEMERLRKDLDGVRQEVALLVNKNRGFSPYSSSPPVTGPQAILPSLFPPAVAPLMTSFTPEAANIHMTLKDPIQGQNQGRPCTFEDALRRSRVEVDCNINNCRNNNQSSASVTAVAPACPRHPRSQRRPKREALVNPVLRDFVGLSHQIRGLRRMAESVFRNNLINNRCAHSQSKTRCGHEPVEDAEDLISSQSHISKAPHAETTLSLLNRCKLVSPSAGGVRVSSCDSGSSNEESGRSSHSEEPDCDVVGDTTSCCLCTDEQLATTTTSTALHHPRHKQQPQQPQQQPQQPQLQEQTAARQHQQQRLFMPVPLCPHCRQTVVHPPRIA